MLYSIIMATVIFSGASADISFQFPKPWPDGKYHNYHPLILAETVQGDDLYCMPSRVQPWQDKFVMNCQGLPHVKGPYGA